MFQEIQAQLTRATSVSEYLTAKNNLNQLTQAQQLALVDKLIDARIRVSKKSERA